MIGICLLIGISFDIDYEPKVWAFFGSRVDGGTNIKTPFFLPILSGDFQYLLAQIEHFYLWLNLRLQSAIGW